MGKGSFFDKIKDVARSAIKTPEGRADYDDDDEDDRDFFSLADDESYDKYYGEPEKPKLTSWQQKQPESPAYAQSESRYSDYKDTKATGNVFRMKQEASGPKFKFALVKIDKIEAAVGAADFMLSGNTVALLDLHDLPENAARRVIDFLDGVRYTCNARIELIADRTYVIVPESVELSGDFLSQVDTNGFRF